MKTILTALALMTMTVTAAIAQPINALPDFVYVPLPCTVDADVETTFARDPGATFERRSAWVLSPFKLEGRLQHHPMWIIIAKHPDREQALAFLINGAGLSCEAVLLSQRIVASIE